MGENGGLVPHFTPTVLIPLSPPGLRMLRRPAPCRCLFFDEAVELRHTKTSLKPHARIITTRVKHGLKKLGWCL